MKRIIFALLLPMAGASGQALAQCDGVGTRLDETALSKLLTDHTVCAVPGNSHQGSPGDRWQEEHLAGGALWDYRQGNCTPGISGCTNPREQVGTWSITGSGDNAAVSYAHNGGGSYTRSVYQHMGHYSFCEGSLEYARATVTGPGNGCATFPP